MASQARDCVAEMTTVNDKFASSEPQYRSPVSAALFFLGIQKPTLSGMEDEPVFRKRREVGFCLFLSNQVFKNERKSPRTRKRSPSCAQSKPRQTTDERTAELLMSATGKCEGESDGEGGATGNGWMDLLRTSYKTVGGLS
jgi:hypothetical protein